MEFLVNAVPQPLAPSPIVSTGWGWAGWAEAETGAFFTGLVQCPRIWGKSHLR